MNKINVSREKEISYFLMQILQHGIGPSMKPANFIQDGLLSGRKKVLSKKISVMSINISL
jgi:hypothetical protein